MKRDDAALGVALLGYGYAGRTLHAPLLEATPGLRLVAVHSSRPAAVGAERPAVFASAELDAVLGRPDVALVVIATPNDTHAALARRALLAGKHVVVDKPVTVRAADAVELQRLAQTQRRLLSVFHNRRWDADFLTVGELVGRGVLGEVSYFESRLDRYRPQVRDRWREGEGEGAGLWFDLGPHLLDQALLLFGPPLAIQADLARQRPGARAVDYFHVQLHYARRRVVLHAGMLAADAGWRFVVHGDRGSYLKRGGDVQEDALRAGRRPGDGDRAGWGIDRCPGELHRVGADGAPDRVDWLNRAGDYPAYYAAMVAAIRDGAPLPVAMADAVAVMQLLELGCASAAAGKLLPVPAAEPAVPGGVQNR